MNIKIFKDLAELIFALVKMVVIIALLYAGLTYLMEIFIKADFNLFNIFDFPDISFREWLLTGIFLVLIAILFILIGKK